MENIPVFSQAAAFSAAGTSAVPVPRQRYAFPIRAIAGILVAIIAGFWVSNSMQVGAALSFGRKPWDDWTILFWEEHWAWRAAWSLAATAVGGFLGGMIARRAGSWVGAISALPTAALWAFVAFVGWSGSGVFNIPASDVPAGYKIVASILALLTVPIGAAAAEAGAPYGDVNAEHFDSRRGTLLGVRWYHVIWLQFLIHALIIQATWAAMYSFGWIVASWKAGMSISSMIPYIFMIAMLYTMGWMFTGAFKAYEALAHFDDDESGQSLFKRVLKYGFGYPLGAAAAQLAIVGVHYGAYRLFN